MSPYSVVRLGSLLEEAESGFACAKRNLVADGLPHLRPFNIGTNGELDLSETFLVPVNLAPAGKRLIKAGDILFNNTNSVELVGKSALVQEDMDAGFSNHMTRLRVNSEEADPAFIAAVLNKRWAAGLFASQCTRWVGQAAINSTALKAMEIPLPPLNEQRRIVDVLSSAASIRRMAELAAATAEHVSGALMSRLFA